ncbi:MAG: hypothetical protein HHJ09_13920 [Glaciimonas sp.]|nr:hypothetical protein [Glaciimonas sp.]
MRKLDSNTWAQIHRGEITFEEANWQVDEEERQHKVIAEERQAKITAAVQKMPDQAHIQLMDAGSLSKSSCYRLAEAAELVEMKESDLLRHAIKGALILAVSIPDNVKVTASICAVNEIQDENTVDQAFITSIYPWREEIFGGNTDLSVPNMLILSRLNCQKIYLNKEIEESSFRSGYQISDSGDVFYANPRASNAYIRTVATSDSSFPQRFFVEQTAIWKIGGLNGQTGLEYGKEKIKINFDNLFVMDFNLKVFSDNFFKEKSIMTCNVTSSEECPNSSDMGKVMQLTSNRIALSSPQISDAFGGCLWDTKQWKRSLGDPPKWLVNLRVKKGEQKPGGAAMWDPLAIAMHLLEEKGIPLLYLNKAFKSPDLEDLFDEWQDIIPEERKPN